MYDPFLDPPFVTPSLIYRSLTNTFSFLYTSAFVHLSFLTSVLLTCPPTVLGSDGMKICARRVCRSRAVMVIQPNSQKSTSVGCRITLI